MPRAPPIFTLGVGRAFQSSLGNQIHCSPSPVSQGHTHPARAKLHQRGRHHTWHLGPSWASSPLSLHFLPSHPPFICAFTGTVSSTAGPLLSYLQENSSSFSLTVVLRLGLPMGTPRPGTRAPVDELDHRLHLASFRPQIKSRSGQTPAWGFACTEHDLQATHLI